jgi:hypothetical protein
MADGLCDLGGGMILAEVLHVWVGQGMTLSNYTLAFAIQLRKSAEKLILGGRVIRRYSRQLGRFIKDSLG